MTSTIKPSTKRTVTGTVCGVVFINLLAVGICTTGAQDTKGDVFSLFALLSFATAGFEISQSLI